MVTFVAPYPSSMNATEWAAWIGLGTGVSSFALNFARFLDDRRSGISVSAETGHDSDAGMDALFVKATCRTKRPISLEEPEWEFRTGPFGIKRKVFAKAGPAAYFSKVPDNGRLEDAAVAEYRFSYQDWSHFQGRIGRKDRYPTYVFFRQASEKGPFSRRRRKFRGKLPTPTAGA